MPQQLNLPIGPPVFASFGNFYVGPNGELVQVLKSLIEGSAERNFVFIYGRPGCGKTHLLQAICRDATENSLLSAYLTLAGGKLAPSLLGRLNPEALVAVDDLHVVIGQKEWEEQLLSLFERLVTQEGTLVVAANGPPSALNAQLPDLVSRLGSGFTYRLKPLDDADKVAALKLRAEQRGFEIPDNVVEYLLAHGTRDPGELFALLDRIDEASLSRQRRVTIPFIKELDQSFN
jgi:DnaA family protein